MKPLDLSSRRLWCTTLVLVIAFALVFYQLVQLMVIRENTLKILARGQHHLKVEIPAIRGNIYERRGKELATSLKIPSVYAVPRVVGSSRKEALAEKVSKILGLEKSWVMKRLLKDKAFIWLKRKVTFEQAEKIRNLKDPGLGILEEYKRFYPQGELMSQILGFTDIDNKGLEGVELMYDRDLKGRPGLRRTKRDALGREIKALEMYTLPPIHGNNVYLTIDQYFQYLTERSLDVAYKKWKAKGAAAMLMDAQTGRILAMASRPNYDANDLKNSQVGHRRNRVITDMYEPGSVFKMVTASAVLNEGKATLDQLFDCENGEYRYGSKVLHDVHPYGELTFEEVLIKSSNIGITKIASLIEPETFQSYIEKFGFGRKTGIDLIGEVSGFTRPPTQWSSTSPYNIPMGHEILVTLLQMTRAMAVIANGGKLMKPFAVERIVDQAGVTLYENQPEVTRQVLKPEVAEKMRRILTRVVEEGTGKRARIPGIQVGGKTGTAQKVLPNGKGYSHEDFMSSFVGFAPSENPKFVMAVVLDDPGPSYYGGTVAAPVFQEVMQAVLRTIGYVPPDAKIILPVPSRQETQENPPILLAA